MNDNARPSTIPTAIHAERAARTLSIAWADGHRTTYDFTALRWLCPCAYCRGEAGEPGWLDSAPTLTPAQTEMADVRLVGSYAIAPTWGDGHDSGFYPFDQLRRSCGCEDCAMRRTAETGAGTAGPTSTPPTRARP